MAHGEAIEGRTLSTSLDELRGRMARGERKMRAVERCFPDGLNHPSREQLKAARKSLRALFKDNQRQALHLRLLERSLAEAAMLEALAPSGAESELGRDFPTLKAELEFCRVGLEASAALLAAILAAADLAALEGREQ